MTKLPLTSDVPTQTSPAPAIWAEGLFLLHLTLLPGIAWLALYVLKKMTRSNSPLVRCHVDQTLRAGAWVFWGYVLLAGLIVWLGGIYQPVSWVVLEIYFPFIHGAWLMMGILGLTRAMSGQLWRFPLVGPALPKGKT